MAKASDSRVLDGEETPQGDPLGELSDIMGFSKDGTEQGDISLDLERELFGVNDSSATEDEPADGQYADAAASLESELMAVLGGLGETPETQDAPGEASMKAAGSALPAADDTFVDTTAPAPADDSAADILADLEFDDVDLGELEAAALEAANTAQPPETSEVATEAELGADELEALFADVMEPHTDITEEPVAHQDVAPGIEDQVTSESGDNRAFEDGVDLANVLAASHPQIGDGEAGAAGEDGDPIEDAFSDLADLDVPSFIGTAAGTRAAMAAVDAQNPGNGEAQADPALDAGAHVTEEPPAETVDVAQALDPEPDVTPENDAQAPEPAAPDPEAAANMSLPPLELTPQEISADRRHEPAPEADTAPEPETVSEAEVVGGLEAVLNEISQGAQPDEIEAATPVAEEPPELLPQDEPVELDQLGGEMSSSALPVTVAEIPEAAEAAPQSGDEAAFAELLAGAEAQMTDEDFEAAAAAIGTEPDQPADTMHASFDDDAAVADADVTAPPEDDVPPATPEPDIGTEQAAPAQDEPLVAQDDPQAEHADDAEPLPEIDISEVVEGIAATTEFEIPDLHQEETPVVAPGDEFEADFAASLARYREEQATPEPALTEPEPETFDFAREFETLFDRDGLSDDAAKAMAAATVVAGTAAATQTAGEDAEAHQPELGLADDLDQPIGIPPVEPAVQPPEAGRRGYTIAAAVGVVAIVGVAFAAGSSFFGGDDTVPEEAAIIRAETEPVKIKPDDPGGATVPNQDSAVYDRVAGTADPAPAQENLISTAEEPVDLPEQTPPQVPVQKAEDRLLPESTAQDEPPTESDVALIAPKRVRTMIVTSDGSLVEREEPVAAPAAVSEAPAAVAEAVQPESGAPATQEAAAITTTGDAETPAPAAEETQIASLAPAEAPAIEQPAPQVPAAPATETGPLVDVAIPTPRPNIEAEVAAGQQQVALAAADTTSGAATPIADDTLRQEPIVPVRTVRSQTIRPDSAEGDAQTGQVSRTVPVPVERSADQPVTVVGRTGVQETTNAAAQQVAAAAPAPAAPQPAAPTGGYVVQIASLPSVAEAQNSFASLSSRYADLIGGRPMNIQRAEIPGKGTYYRVRVSAQDKSDAVSLCTRIKATGGGCFVAR